MNKTISGFTLLAAAFGLAAVSAPASATVGSSTGCDPDAATDEMWECLEKETSPGTYADITDTGWDGPFTFRGNASLSHWAVGRLDCVLEAVGYVEMDETIETVPGDDPHDNVEPGSDEVNIRVTSLTSSGSVDCEEVEFRNLPLYAYDKDNGNRGIQDDDDVHPPHTGTTTGVLGNSSNKLIVHHAGFGLDVCEDTVNLTFGNSKTGNKNDPSFFEFNDSLSGWLGSCGVQGTLYSVEVYDEDGNWVSGDVNAW